MPEIADDPLVKQAKALMGAASALAVSSFPPMLEKLPFLNRVDAKDWDFFVTVAAVFTAATRLNSLKLAPEREERLMLIVQEGFVRWSPQNAIGAFEDCREFFDRNVDALAAAGHEERYVASDAIGTWIAYNVLSGPPPNTSDSRQFISTMGAFLVHTFFDWWNEGRSGRPAAAHVDLG